jgi:hypothetical protein
MITVGAYMATVGVSAHWHEGIVELRGYSGYAYRLLLYYRCLQIEPSDIVTIVPNGTEPSEVQDMITDFTGCSHAYVKDNRCESYIHDSR